ncbi:short-chain fatty acids transporter [Desulfofundulus luciae]|uniref:Short-chain fatty acids transporter n=1 Tax=Desulfofundulus luciae TaxID=74702 RepID=A0ABU0AXX3_9FIRM|nr:TIGR00366 family protein [Desulfofundulus luciae]MDQ0285334.1 short-chain fatty acids transporter [Desulfofundulus luciae]
MSVGPLPASQAQPRGFTRWLTGMAERYVPDSYVIVLILTFVTFILGLLLTNSTPLDLVADWGKGFWVLLEFAMQMTLIVVTGYALATTPFVNRVLVRMAGVPRTASGVYVYAVVITFIAYYINWGFGLIFSALFARELARQASKNGVKADYKLIVAAAYATFIIWHVGLSGSVPLLVATSNHFMVKEMGVIPVSQTLFVPYTIITMLLVVLVTVFLFWKVLPPKENQVVTMEEVDPEAMQEQNVVEAVRTTGPVTPADRLMYSGILSYIMAAMFLVYLGYHFFVAKKCLDINLVNFIFLMLIILLHRTPANLIRAVQKATPAAWGIILQFPFYAGIFGMMKFSGLVEVFAQWILSVTTAQTFPAFVAILSAIMGYFIPSGGSKWAVEAPYIIAAGAQLGVPHAKTVIAYAFGNDWINLIQPFWALPFLTVVKLNFREIVGYTTLVFVVTGVVILLGLTFVPF